ncbi:phosphoadenosine phosphosulfate reductase [Citrobacter freundii]
MYIEIKETFLELPSEIQFSEAANAAILTQDKWGDVWQTLKTDADLNYTDAGEPVSLASRVTTATSAIYHAITEGWTMCVGYSGGKDSHSLLHLFLMALIRAVRNGSNVSQHHFIQISNTLIENPEMHHQSTQVLSQLRAFIAEQQLPVTVLVAQRFLTKIQYDWSLRDYIGRKVFEGGYVRLQPNVFSSSLTERLFHICCSFDYVEAQRAAAVREKLLSGEVEDTAHNRRMAEPQFRLVQEANVLHIDFLWSLHCFNPRPFRAIELYRQVWEGGALDLLDDEPAMQPVPRTPMPAPRWMKLPEGRIGTSFDGLSDPSAEMAYFDGREDDRASRSLLSSGESLNIVAFEEEDELTVDEDTASWIIWHEYDGLRQRVSDGEFTPVAAAQYLLRYGAVRISRGKGAVYHRLAQRGQAFSRLGINDQTPLPSLLVSHRFKILTDCDYRLLVARKLRGQRQKLRFWCCVAACVALHTHNRTPLGAWITTQLENERQQHLARTGDELKAGLLDAVLTLCNLRIKPQSMQPEERLYYRAVRKRFLTTLARCISQEYDETLREVIWALRMLSGPQSSKKTGFRHVDDCRESTAALLRPLLNRLVRLLA